ncbi:Diaminopimelate epimerase (DAP epimerase) [Rickettsia prowazekii str. Rp22]|uniref:Diaminopimelate epimerase (DAP epimerase) n=1 Tax=Rickettsia prowazekii (strain Rp22) TaxID=449216 RepID=D5AX57_RICPP|nr:Diaminopimelate epimerase (DAP epimerase) [Rickettsia prowazekii str. Rp22]
MQIIITRKKETNNIFIELKKHFIPNLIQMNVIKLNVINILNFV